MSFLSYHLPFEIIIKEVGIKQSLDNAAKIYHKVMLIMRLKITPINPIQDIESSIGTHEKNIVPREILYLTIPLQYN